MPLTIEKVLIAGYFYKHWLETIGSIRSTTAALLRRKKRCERYLIVAIEVLNRDPNNAGPAVLERKVDLNAVCSQLKAVPLSLSDVLAGIRLPDFGVV